jgi:VanZ family protein
MPSFQFSDKVLHFIAYAVLGILFYRAFRTLPFQNNRRLVILLSITAATLYGVSDEIHQHFVPFRDADLLDAIANFLGAVCGVYLFQLWSISEDRKQGSKVR